METTHVLRKKRGREEGQKEGRQKEEVEEGKNHVVEYDEGMIKRYE